MLRCWRHIWKRTLIVLTAGLAVSWFVTHYWRLKPHRVDVGLSLSLNVDQDSDVELRLRSPDGGTRLRGTLATDDGVFVRGTIKRCSVAGSRMEAACADLRTNEDDGARLRLEVTFAGNVDCYAVTWRAPTATEETQFSVVNCFDLGDAHWYGGAQIRRQRWPVNRQRSAMQPHVTGDHVAMHWRKNPSYGKYGSLAEPYWVTSAGVGILVNDSIALSSSFNADGDGRMCLKGDRHRETDDDERPAVLSYTVCVGENVAAVHRTMSRLLFPRPTGVPDERMMRRPIWSTWAQFKVNVNQTNVEEMADKILQYNFPHSQLEIDDRYTTTYGQFDFDVAKFPNASRMIQTLHDRGFRVTTWITPFSNLDCPATSEGAPHRHWITDSASPPEYPVPALTVWWQGAGVILDATSTAAVDWFSERLRRFVADYGIDSFKFDAGEVDYLPPRGRTAVSLTNPNRYTTLYVNMAATFGRMIEVRTAFRNQDLPVFFRMLDKDSVWGRDNGLRSLIPTALAFGIAGYPFVLPDMIGGNGVYGEEVDLTSTTAAPGRELFLRWTELTAFMPAMQFSVVPWQYDGETVGIARKFARLHQNDVGDVIEAAAKEAVLHGWPIVRPLWWMSPTDPVALTCDSQFLLGDRLLVSPVLYQGARSRDVYLPGTPEVRWRDYFAGADASQTLPGGTWLRNRTVEIDQIAVFLRVD